MRPHAASSVRHGRDLRAVPAGAAATVVSHERQLRRWGDIRRSRGLVDGVPLHGSAWAGGRRPGTRPARTIAGIAPILPALHRTASRRGLSSADDGGGRLAARGRPCATTSRHLGRSACRSPLRVPRPGAPQPCLAEVRSRAQCAVGSRIQDHPASRRGATRPRQSPVAGRLSGGGNDLG
jgi:hypothetical protein